MESTKCPLSLIFLKTCIFQLYFKLKLRKAGGNLNSSSKQCYITNTRNMLIAKGIPRFWMDHQRVCSKCLKRYETPRSAKVHAGKCHMPFSRQVAQEKNLPQIRLS